MASKVSSCIAKKPWNGGKLHEQSTSILAIQQLQIYAGRSDREKLFGNEVSTCDQDTACSLRSVVA